MTVYEMSELIVPPAPDPEGDMVFCCWSDVDGKHWGAWLYSNELEELRMPQPDASSVLQ